MLKDLKYFTAKYARDEETGEIFAVGFFGSYLRKGSGGVCFTLKVISVKWAKL